MIKLHEMYSTELSRRRLLQGATCAGAASVIFAATKSAEAKMSKQSVGYQATAKGDKSCANCRLFEAPNSCKNVEGPVSGHGYCMIWSKA